MKHFSKIKMLASAVVVTAAIAVSGITSEAKIITEKQDTVKAVSYVGDTFTNPDSCNDLKINGKKYSKMKSKVNTIVTSTSPASFSYRTKSYFGSSSSYKTYGDYIDATEGAIKYITYSDYELRFLKRGTYTITWNEYSKEDLYADEQGYDQAKGKYYYYITKYNNDEDRWKSIDNKKYYRGYGWDDDDPYYGTGVDTYYISEDGKSIYAYSDEEDDYVLVTFKTDANGAKKAYYSPRNVIKRAYKYQVKVMANSAVVKSVQLGKSKYTTSMKNGKYSSSGTYTASKFLSGKSGKLTVKMANSNYKVSSIVVKTYDAAGKAVYTLVKNNKNLTYGANKSLEKYDNGYGYAYMRSSMYKATEVYVFYKNAYANAYCKIDKIYKDTYGNYRFDYTYRYAGDEKATTVKETSNLPGSFCYSYTFYKK